MKRILLISTNAIGDTYIACSAFSPLKKLYPHVEIDIVALESSAFFLKKIDFKNFFLLKRKSYSEVVKQLTVVRKVKYDLVLNFFPGQVNSFFFQFSSAEKKAGFWNIKKQNDWHNDDAALTVKSSNPDDVRSNTAYIWKKTDNYLNRIHLSLKAAGIEVNEIKKPVFNVKKIPVKKYDVVLHLFSSDADRNFPYEKIGDILKKLSEDKTLEIALLGNISEINSVKELLNFETNINFIVLPEIETLVSIMQNAALFIGVDSFPLHIADAHSIKTVALFTCTNENSVLQNIENKFILRIEDVSKFKASDLMKFIKDNNLLK